LIAESIWEAVAAATQPVLTVRVGLAAASLAGSSTGILPVGPTGILPVVLLA